MEGKPKPCLGRSIGFIGHYLDQLRPKPQETGQELHSWM